MPKIDLTEGEVTELLNALDMAGKSARRAQNTGRSPQIKEVWATHERSIQNLANKLMNAK